MFLKNCANPGIFFVYFGLSNTKITEETVVVSGIRTQIVEVEGEHTDHSTTTMSQGVKVFATH